MGRQAGRTAEQTKQEILQAASRVIARRGSNVAVSDICQVAGVSKGGLLYHFPNKEKLLAGVAAYSVEQFRGEVERYAAAEAEGTPGRLCRAYVRASFAVIRDSDGLRDSIALAAQLMYEPGLAGLVQQDADSWREVLMGDGLEPAVVRMIIAAADGSNIAPLWGAVLNEADVAALETELLEMTYAAGE
ncbi:MAG: TetR family transcriptional regulator [Kocuria sp.]|nr:TetR family transcriptional regulator [Kocuria sp.]